MLKPKTLHPDESFIIKEFCDFQTRNLLEHDANRDLIRKKLNLEGYKNEYTEMDISLAITTYLRDFDRVKELPETIFALNYRALSLASENIIEFKKAIRGSSSLIIATGKIYRKLKITKTYHDLNLNLN